MMTENTNTFKNSSKRIMRRGFTLIEILIVVVILGVLAALVIPGVVGALNDSKENAASARASQILTMVTRYNAFNPTTAIDLPTGTNTKTFLYGDDDMVKITGKGYCTEDDLKNQLDPTKGWTYSASTKKITPVKP